jgi:hypothetical protein
VSAPDAGRSGASASGAGAIGARASGAGASGAGTSGAGAIGAGDGDFDAAATNPARRGARPDSRPDSRPGALPDIGLRMPGATVRVLLGLVGVALVFLTIPVGFWFVIGLILTALAVAAPALLGAWGLIVLLSIATLTRPESAFDGRFFVLLAGLHLLHVLGAQTLVLPWRAWVQVGVLRAPLLRFVVIQVPVQVLAFVVLLLVAPSGAGNGAGAGTGTASGIGDLGAAGPIAAVIGAVALGAVVVILIVPLLRERPRQ